MLEHFREVYKFRALIKALVVRHLNSRYRGSLLGFLWSFLNPLCLMLIYTLVFKYYVRFDQVDNYTIFLFCGLLPWLWIAAGLNESTSAIVSGGSLLTKSMFPAHLLSTVAILTALVHFILSLPLLFLFMFLAGMSFSWSLIFLPVVIGVQLVLMYGLGLMLASLNVQFRDMQHIVGNLLTFLFFLCPILYPITVVPERFRFTLEFNPLAVLITFYHSIVLDGVLPDLIPFFGVVLIACLTLFGGIAVYNRHRESFAELL